MSLTEVKEISQVVVALIAAGFIPTGAVIYASIKKLRQELSRNGGLTVRDAIDRIEAKISKLESTQTRLVEGQRFIFTLLEAPIWECNGNGDCIYASPELCAMFGMTEQEMLGNGWLSAIATQEERTNVKHAWETAVREKLAWRQEFTIHNRWTGERCLIEDVMLRRVNDKSGDWFAGTCTKKHCFKTRATEVDTAIAWLHKTEEES